MRMRLTWILAILALVAIGVLMACSTKYSASSNGLVIVPSTYYIPGTANTPVMQSFSLNLSNGHIAQINNVNGPPIDGLPTAVVLDPAGAFAYVIIYQNSAVPGSETGIETFPVTSDGKLGVGVPQTLNGEQIYLNGPSNPPESVPAVPVALAMDSGGRFLFVADTATEDSVGNSIPGAVSVFSIGSDGSLTEVANSPFVLPVGAGANLSTPGPCTASQNCSSTLSLAVTPTVFPPAYAFCSGFAPPTTENLYVADSVNYVLLNYSVDLTAGALNLVPYASGVPGIPTGTVPSGVAVDPCARYAFVANASPSNSVSAYKICSLASVVSQPPCPVVDFSLNAIGLPAPAGDNPGPITMDAYANFLYVVNTGGSSISPFKVNQLTGTLTALSPTPVATNLGANSIAVRADDSFAFVANTTSGNVSQYAITPASGALTPQSPITTYNNPSGVAVK
jgi:6-phosphogluconolactonase (cycloisomerase 2 family)